VPGGRWFEAAAERSIDSKSGHRPRKSRGGDSRMAAKKKGGKKKATKKKAAKKKK
jgi:hypothetical protein